MEGEASSRWGWVWTIITPLVCFDDFSQRELDWISWNDDCKVIFPIDGAKCSSQILDCYSCDAWWQRLAVTWPENVVVLASRVPAEDTSTLKSVNEQRENLWVLEELRKWTKELVFIGVHVWSLCKCGGSHLSWAFERMIDLVSSCLSSLSWPFVKRLRHFVSWVQVVCSWTISC